jgi:PHP family Zn ribbon phosphoesterase
VDADINNSGIDERVIRAINAFKEGKVKVCPGGGGQYGTVELPGSDAYAYDAGKNCGKTGESQRSLLDFE